MHSLYPTLHHNNKCKPMFTQRLSEFSHSFAVTSSRDLYKWTNIGNSDWGFRGQFRIQPRLLGIQPRCVCSQSRWVLGFVVQLLIFRWERPQVRGKGIFVGRVWEFNKTACNITAYSVYDYIYYNYWWMLPYWGITCSCSSSPHLHFYKFVRLNQTMVGGFSVNCLCQQSKLFAFSVTRHYVV